MFEQGGSLKLYSLQVHRTFCTGSRSKAEGATRGPRVAEPSRRAISKYARRAMSDGPCRVGDCTGCSEGRLV